MNLLIRNLSRDTTEKEVHDMFARFGQVAAHNLVLDQKTGKSKGFGFADMPDEKEANAAIRGLDGRVFKGSRIRVKKASRPGSNG